MIDKTQGYGYWMGLRIDGVSFEPWVLKLVLSKLDPKKISSDRTSMRQTIHPIVSRSELK